MTGHRPGLHYEDGPVTFVDRIDDEADTKAAELEAAAVWRAQLIASVLTDRKAATA